MPRISWIMNRSRSTTYPTELDLIPMPLAVPGQRRNLSEWGSGAHGGPGDLIIIVTYATYDGEEISRHQPTIVLVDRDNKAIKLPALVA